MNDLFATLGDIGLIPVLAVERAEDAVPLAEALQAGGLRAVEVTFRTGAAARVLAAMAGVPGLLPGAGTILTPDQVDQAVDLGARFGLAPGFNPRVAARALDKKFPFIPGVLTPSEMGAALDMGFTVQKFFPAESAGGAAYLKAVGAPLRGIRFVPTGGITPESIPAYLALPSVLCVGGSWMAAPKLVQDRNFAEITRLAQAAVDIIRAHRPRRPGGGEGGGACR